VVDDRGEIALAAPVADLINADGDEPLQTALVEVVGQHAFDDATDRVPGDAQKPGDRGLGHLLGQPGHHILEVAGVARAVACPRHRLELRAAVKTPHATQVAFDKAPLAAQIEMPPALEAVIVAAHAPPGLTAAAAYQAPAPESHGHEHPLDPEAHVDDRRADQTQKPVERRGDAHVALLAGRLTI